MELFYDFATVCVEGLPQLRNLPMSLDVTGVGSIPIRSHFIWRPETDPACRKRGRKDNGVVFATTLIA